MKVKDVMTEHAQCISPNDSIQAAAQKMKNFDVGPLPVCENNRLVGIITDRDIVVRGVCEACDTTTTTVKDIMTPHITRCFEDQEIEEAAELMREQKIRRLAVLNRNKRLVGIISLGDLAAETGDEHLSWETLERGCEPVWWE
ncbi:MAG: CBS domain-containing protein [Thermoguttaceae bacterium]